MKKIMLVFLLLTVFNCVTHSQDIPVAVGIESNGSSVRKSDPIYVFPVHSLLLDDIGRKDIHTYVTKALLANGYTVTKDSTAAKLYLIPSAYIDGIDKLSGIQVGKYVLELYVFRKGADEYLLTIKTYTVMKYTLWRYSFPYAIAALLDEGVLLHPTGGEIQWVSKSSVYDIEEKPSVKKARGFLRTY